jgi:uncharacterized protein
VTESYGAASPWGSAAMQPVPEQPPLWRAPPRSAGGQTGAGTLLSEMLTGGGKRQSVAEALAKSVVRSVGSQVGTQIGRSLMRGVLGSLLR